jgi:fructose-1,6-bisphosphatase II
MGSGGAPEGVLTAAALCCLGGEIFARLVVDDSEQARRCREMHPGVPARNERGVALPEKTSCLLA